MPTTWTPRTEPTTAWTQRYGSGSDTTQTTYQTGGWTNYNTNTTVTYDGIVLPTSWTDRTVPSATTWTARTEP